MNKIKDGTPKNSRISQESSLAKSLKGKRKKFATLKGAPFSLLFNKVGKILMKEKGESFKFIL